MKRFLILFILLDIIILQTDVKSLIADVKNGDLSEATSYLNSLKNLPADSPEIIYLAGLIESDSEKAVELFGELVNQFPDDPIAMDAMMKMGEYYYVTGLYVQAANWFRRIADDDKDYHELERTARLLIKSLNISGESQLVREYTDKFLKKYPDFLSDKIAEKEQKTITRYAVKPVTQKGGFSLQVGAFSQIEGANNRADMLVTAGYDARVETSYSGGTELNTVLVGNFKDRKSAERMKSVLKKDQGMDSFIVTK